MLEAGCGACAIGWDTADDMAAGDEDLDDEARYLAQASLFKHF